ncbi:MAG: pyrroloquinoline quinone-dependent dehydrogenase [Proteobacteria bacterium]|nr:pyrroloquinoline quinone-dependent dehydrogenase [Pseudomonadota bacterium]
MKSHRWLDCRTRRCLLAGTVLALAAATACGQGWPVYGGEPGGGRYSSAAQVTAGNVARLGTAWTFHTGELGEGLARRDKLTFESTPILVGRTLYFNTATAIVFAVDAASGALRWRYDARINRGTRFSEMAARGVATWATAGNGPCSTTIFAGTIDARLIALDAESGQPCEAFGAQGVIDLSRGVRLRDRGEYLVTSPPAVVGDVVVVGSAIGDNRGTSLELGVVRGYDARSGALRWAWDPIPRAARIPAEAGNPAFGDVEAQAATWTGAANAWSLFSAAPEQGLVFVPTGSASPDFFGGERPGDNHWANSVVALDAATGVLRWGRQLVHHDLWDYDVASQPVVATLTRDGVRRAVVLQVTKTGELFVLDRDDGTPVYPIEERAVPGGAAEGETAAPTQPHSTLPALVPQGPVRADDAWGLTFWDRGRCADLIRSLRSDGIFTPPTVGGSIERPGYVGGANWGGLAYDPQHQYAIAVVNDLPMVVALVPRAQYESTRDSDAYPKYEFASMRGTPYGMRRDLLRSPLGLPCTAPPWGALVAVDVARGRIAWRVPLGTLGDMAWPLRFLHGSPAIGGPIVTAGGLVFVGAASDDYLRAFDIGTGQELWKGRLPAGGQATPMTYVLDGRQYVVIAAGGHAGLGTTRGDSLVAFALPN